MNRKIQYTINGAIGGSLISALINGFDQLNRIEVNSQLKFEWSELIKSFRKGALIGGGAGFIIGAIVDEVNANTKPINTDEYLNTFVYNVKANKNSNLYIKGERKCEQIIKFLEKEFASELTDVPFQWGSTVKGTAIEGKSDFDIMARFYHNSFKMGEMFDNVLSAFEERFEDSKLIEIIDQKKSIGLIFHIENEKVKVDVVPMRAANDNPKTTASYLYVNNKGLFSKPSITKTDIPLQASFQLTPTQKKLIIMLKKWKVDNDVPISSYLIQLLVVKAFERNRNKIPRKLTDKLMLVLNFMAENINTIRLVSPENTNNIVSNIPETDKETIRKKALNVVEEYEYHPNTIQSFFALEK